MAQFLDKFRFRQVVGRTLRVAELERTATGDEQVHRADAQLLAEQAREFEAEHRPHAVTEEGERQIEVWAHCQGQFPQDVGQTSNLGSHPDPLPGIEWRRPRWETKAVPHVR